MRLFDRGGKDLQRLFVGGVQIRIAQDTGPAAFLGVQLHLVVGRNAGFAEGVLLGTGILCRRDLNGGAARQLEDLADISIPGGFAANHLDPAEILQSHNEQLGRAFGGLIGQHHQRQIDRVGVRFRYGGQVALLIAGIGYGTVRQQRIQHLDRIGQLVAGNPAQIQYRALYVLRFQVVEQGGKLVGGGPAEFGKADIGNLIIDRGAFYGGNINNTQRQLVVVLLTVLLDGQRDLGARFPAQLCRVFRNWHWWHGCHPRR